MYTQVAYWALKAVEESGSNAAPTPRSQPVRGRPRPRPATKTRVRGGCPVRVGAGRLGKGLGKKIKLILGFAVIDKRNFDEIQRAVDDSLQLTPTRGLTVGELAVVASR
jgi:hypothetical protein